MRATVALVLWMWLCPGVYATAQDPVGGPLAGATDLAPVEGQIQVMRRLIADLDAQKTDTQQRGVDLLYQTARSQIETWTDYLVPPPQRVDQLGPWYVQAMHDRHGFDLLGPVSPWLQGWIGLRRHEHQLQDAYEELRVALRRLEHVRDRLRAQLGLPAATEGPNKP